MNRHPDTRLRALMETQFSGIWSYLYACTADVAAADDFAQEVLVRTLAHLDKNPTSRNAPICLYLTARNLWRDRTRSPETTRITLTSHSDTLTDLVNFPMTDEERLVTAVLTDDLWQQVIQLPRLQREAVMLCERGRLTFRDIADVTGKRESVVHTQYRKGVRRLCKRFRKVNAAFGAELGQRFQTLPAKSLTDDQWSHVLAAIESTPADAWNPTPVRQPHRLPIRTAIVGAGVAVVAGMAWYSLQLQTHRPAHPQWPVYPMVVPPSSVTPTPLDTAGFRTAARDYLETHALSVAGIANTTSRTSAGLNSVPDAPAPVHNEVSKLAVRWSHVDFGRYGYALISFVGNGQPRSIEVVALKSGTTWSVVRTNLAPTLSPKALSNSALYPMQLRGTLFAAGDNVAFQFVSGLVIDPAVTRVTITTTIGQNATAPVINGVFGFEVTDLTGKLIREAQYTIRAYNARGEWVYVH